MLVYMECIGIEFIRIHGQMRSAEELSKRCDGGGNEALILEVYEKSSYI